MQIVLRTATLEDYEGLFLLYAQLDQVHTEALPEFFRSVEEPARSRQYFAEIIANKDAALFVAEYEGTLVGAIHCFIDDAPKIPFIVPRRFVLIDDMVVDENFRRRGVGQALLERVDQWVREKGLTEVVLGVWEFNTAARFLYEKLGYHTTWRRMRKQLQ
ncbi:MAG TPA: GNAT family N-acetyltransferase [Ktedonobacteraceae bacterium]|nr:GNAT family N-acetyltransferase [Ktedonobacteraceae bacterium]